MRLNCRGCKPVVTYIIVMCSIYCVLTYALLSILYNIDKEQSTQVNVLTKLLPIEPRQQNVLSLLEPIAMEQNVSSTAEVVDIYHNVSSPIPQPTSLRLWNVRA